MARGVVLGAGDLRARPGSSISAPSRGLIFSRAVFEPATEWEPESVPSGQLEEVPTVEPARDPPWGCRSLVGRIREAASSPGVAWFCSCSCIAAICFLKTASSNMVVSPDWPLPDSSSRVEVAREPARCSGRVAPEEGESRVAAPRVTLSGRSVARASSARATLWWASESRELDRRRSSSLPLYLPSEFFHRLPRRDNRPSR